MGDISDFGIDPNPPGTMTPMGLSPDDPLYDWASNQKPSDLTRYLHDPEGFKQDMIDKGVPPPDHDYTRGQDGGLQAIDKTGQPIGRSTMGFATADTSDPFAPVTNPAGGRNLTGPTTQALGYTDPGGGFGQAPETEELKPGGGAGLGQFLKPPPITSSFQKPPPIDPSQMLRPGPEDLPKAVEAPPAEPKSPLDLTSEEQKKSLLQAGTDEEKRKRDALGGFAKALQGVKMPEAPKPAGLIGQSVRSPVAVRTPGIEALLGLAGQRAGGGILPLMRLLGRA